MLDLDKYQLSSSERVEILQLLESLDGDLCLESLSLLENSALHRPMRF